MKDGRVSPHGSPQTSSSPLQETPESQDSSLGDSGIQDVFTNTSGTLEELEEYSVQPEDEDSMQQDHTLPDTSMQNEEAITVESHPVPEDLRVGGTLQDLQEEGEGTVVS